MRAPVWLLVLVVSQLVSSEGRYWHQESRKDVRHRHRHQHESPSRWVHQRRPTDDYDDWTDSDEDESSEDDDYVYYPKRRGPNRSPGRSSRRWQHRVQEETPRRKSHYQSRYDKSRKYRGYHEPRRYHHEVAKKNSYRKHRNYDEEEQTLKRLLDYISRSESRKRKFWSNSSSSVGSRRRNRWEEEEEEEDYLNSDNDPEEENELWRDADEEEDDYDEDEQEKAPLRTFDDIIKRLTLGDPTTPRTSKKDLDIAKYLKRDVYGNLQYDASLNASAKGMVKSVAASGPVQSQVIIDDRKRNESVHTKEPDYDEYSNAEENSSMQADINNAEYAEEENAVGEEEEEYLTSPVPTTTTTTTTTTVAITSPPTTSTTTTVPEQIEPVQHPRYERFHENPTGHQLNGYQARAEYASHNTHKTLETKESGREVREHDGQNRKSAEMREAMQHAIKVMKEGSCQWPRARVIPVRDLYPSMSTMYIPHCAILHRCTDDTGCCRSEVLTCVPKETHKVELYFYATNVIERSSVVEKLTFYNHTECECRERNHEDDTNHKVTEKTVEPTKPPQRKTCRCPSPFSPKVTKGECKCHCHEKNENCIRASRGKVYLSLTDRLCIQDGHCAQPSCEFGTFRTDGRCPRKRDHFEQIENHYKHRFYRV